MECRFPGGMGFAPFAPSTTMVGVAPMTVRMVPSAAGLAPTTYQVTPASFGTATASSPYQVTPAAFGMAAAAPGFALSGSGAAPSTGAYYLPAAPSSAAPSSAPAYSLGAHAAAQAPAAAAQAFAATEAEALTAQQSYPMLAQAARLRNFDGGRFVVFLRSLLKLSVNAAGGPVGLSGLLRPILQDLLVNAVKSQLGFDPAANGMSGEIEKLLAEVAGNGGTSPGSNGLEKCFTIRVCVTDCGGDGKFTVKAEGPGDEKPSPNPQSGGDGRIPISGRPGLPSLAPQSPAPAGATPDDLRPPSIPTVNPAPLTPEPLTPEPDESAPQVEDMQARRHREVMKALSDLNASIGKLADKIK